MTYPTAFYTQGTKTVTYRDRRGVQHVELVDFRIDLTPALLRGLVDKAAANQSGRAVEGGGMVQVTVIHRRAVEGGDTTNAE